MEKIVSILDNIVYLDIETSGLDPMNSEIIEIGAIKINKGNTSVFETLIKNNKEISPEILSLCTGLTINDLEHAPHIYNIKDELIKFLEDKIVICHNARFEEKFLNYYIPEIKNKIIDSMELAAILEPFHKEYNLDYLKKNMTNDKTDEKHRALSDTIDTIKVVNSLLLRLYEKDRLTLEPLTFKVNSYLQKHNLGKWEWSELIDNADYEVLAINSNIDDSELKDNKYNNQKEGYVLRSINSKDRLYEELLKDKSIWESKEGFIYEYRQGQYELTKTIRETFKSHNTGPKVACIEAPTGIGKSVGYLLPAVLEAKLSKKKIIISTDTKELQTQLINKDIPNVLNSLGFSDSIKYGYIKGKNNYICREKLETYKNEYDNKDIDTNDALAILILERLIEEGKYGDIEEINYWIINHYNRLNNHLLYVCCDPNLCRPKKCFKECLYKKRIEELKEEDITVINHSLLAKWPYKEEKPLENIIVDEAHNLAEKGYEFFSSVIDYKILTYFLQEIYPYENIRGSNFYYNQNNKKISKIKAFDKFYHHIHLDRNIKDKISTNINLIVEELNNILVFGQESQYYDISKYNLRWELNLQSEEVAGKLRNNNEIIEIKYDKYSEVIKLSCEKVIRNLKSILFLIDRNIDDDSIDKEADVFKFGKARIKELEDIASIFEVFMEYSEDDDFARIVDIDKSYKSFSFSVVPLKLAQLFQENILSQLESAVFLSATLRVEDSMNYFKNTLGINNVENIEKTIEPLYDYKKMVQVIGINDISSYKNDNFIKDVSNIISNISKVTHGRILSLYNSKDRQERTYENLKDALHSQDTELYMNKNGIKNLKNINKKCVVLGSKGCFEGVDVPGDGLICVTLDKIPNLNPRDPLYSTIMKKYNIPYYKINYPQMAIKVKQAMGRLLRSKYDYGCFIIFNTGSNINTLKKLEKDLHQCNIFLMNTNKIYDYINKHFCNCRKYVINNAILDITNSLNYKNIKVLKDRELYLNNELKNRYIKSEIKCTKEKDNILKIKYFSQRYLIDKDKLKY